MSQVSNNQRRCAVNTLLQFEGTVEQIRTLLGAFPWDSEEELSFLSLDHIRGVLDRYLGGFLTADEVESWANLIEGRDDIGVDPVHHELIQQVLHELANPLITQPLNRERAMQLQSNLATC